MLYLAQAVLIGIGAIVFFLSAILTVQLVASFLPRRKPSTGSLASPTIAALIPAHEEENDIAATVTAVRSQLASPDRVLVVADNCTDKTAAIAREAGAEVIERFDLELRGKGFALEFGRQHLAKAPPEVVVVIDADCRPQPGAIPAIAALAHDSARPVQALYEMERPPGVTARAGIEMSILAWRIRNHARPLGMHNLGLPCQLMGTGMAFPWSILSSRNLATAEIVEDLALGLDLASSRHSPMFAPDFVVTSRLPSGEKAQKGQRTRWEAGHLNLIMRMLPGRLPGEIKARNWPAVALLIDLAIPPLSFFAMAMMAYLILAGGFAAVSGLVSPLVLGMGCGLLFATSVVLGWLRSSRKDVALGVLLSAPFYAVSKIGIYAATIAGQRIGWIRTQRD